MFIETPVERGRKQFRRSLKTAGRKSGFERAAKVSLTPDFSSVSLRSVRSFAAHGFMASLFEVGEAGVLVLVY
jgi:hypothetical protein